VPGPESVGDNPRAPETRAPLPTDEPVVA